MLLRTNFSVLLIWTKLAICSIIYAFILMEMAMIDAEDKKIELIEGEIFGAENINHFKKLDALNILRFCNLEDEA